MLFQMLWYLRYNIQVQHKLEHQMANVLKLKFWSFGIVQMPDHDEKTLLILFPVQQIIWIN